MVDLDYAPFLCSPARPVCRRFGFSGLSRLRSAPTEFFGVNLLLDLLKT
jgi:hypothetical protein